MQTERGSVKANKARTSKDKPKCYWGSHSYHCLWVPSQRMLCQPQPGTVTQCQHSSRGRVLCLHTGLVLPAAPLTGQRDKQLEGTGSNLSSLYLLCQSGSSFFIFASQIPKLKTKKFNSALVKQVWVQGHQRNLSLTPRPCFMHKTLLTTWQIRRGITKKMPQ